MTEYQPIYLPGNGRWSLVTKRVEDSEYTPAWFPHMYGPISMEPSMARGYGGGWHALQHTRPKVT